MMERETIIERVVNGRFVKVTAVDVATGIEATAIGDAHAPPDAVDALAMRKLARQIALETSIQ